MMKHVLTLMLLIMVAACGSDPKPDPAPVDPQPDEPEVTKPILKDLTKLSPEYLMKPNDPVWKTAAPETFHVKFVTTKGSFTVECKRAWAPNGTDRFYNLVRAGYYDDVYFFRVLANFVVQFGMSGDPKRTAIWGKQTIQDDPVRQSNTRGFLTYAQTPARHSRNTQLFINLKNNRDLDGKRFAPFGRVMGDGMKVVDKLFNGYGSNNVPDQNLITSSGNAYLKEKYPKLDRVIRATVLPIK